MAKAEARATETDRRTLETIGSKHLDQSAGAGLAVDEIAQKHGMYTNKLLELVACGLELILRHPLDARFFPEIFPELQELEQTTRSTVRTADPAIPKIMR